MGAGGLRHFAESLPRPVFVVGWALYRAAREVLRTPVWLFRMLGHHIGRPAPELPTVGFHTVFIAKENVLFLKEWIMYHRLKGVEHFFLYDNTGATRSSPMVENSPHTVHGKVSKYGVPYDEIVRLTSEEVQDILDEIERETPGVNILKWRPRDMDGNIMYAQVMALNHALEHYGETVDWMAFMDMDEFLVSKESVPELCRWLESRGFDGGLMADRVMSSRLDHMDRCVIENNMALSEPFPVAPKYLCNTGRVRHANVHSFTSRGRQHRFDPKRAFFLHYKMPSRHPEMNGRFKERDTGIDNALVDALKDEASGYFAPEWRLSKVHPDWSRIMTQVNPQSHLS